MVLERQRPRRQEPPPGYHHTRIKQLGQVEHVHHADKEPLAATLQAKRLDISNMFEPRNQNPKPSNHRSRQLPKVPPTGSNDTIQLHPAAKQLDNQI